MIKFVWLFILFIGFSCSSKSRQEAEGSEQLETKAESIEKMENGLMDQIKGSWIATEFTDSIFNHKKIQPWKNTFYGNLYLVIDESDTGYWNGNMDGGPYSIIARNDSTFEFIQEWGKSTFQYSPSSDIISLGKSRVFKRATTSETVDIIMDEERLMDHVIHKLFTVDYLPSELISKIDYISLGLETYTPFDFDAIRIVDKPGLAEYFAWEFIGDTLKLYQTNSAVDINSGFYYYSKGELDTVYYKR